MSSRSKEKVTAVFKKIFKGNDKVGDASTNETNNNNNNNNNNKSQNCIAEANGLSNDNAADNAGAADASTLMESPGKRMRRTNYQSSSTARGNLAGLQLEGLRRPLSLSDTTIRARRLMKEYKEMLRVQKTKKNPEYTIELVNDNLYEWHARLHAIDPDSKLAKDMLELGIPHILLHLVFPDNFPFAPPFMRVVEPRIEKGFVMEGGAICMELLTPRGWASAYTVEAVIMQFSASIVKGQGRVARKQKGNKDFTRRSAEESFRSLVKTHEKYGWVTPALADG